MRQGPSEQLALGAALLAWLMLLAAPCARAEEPAGKTIHVGCAAVAPSIFQVPRYVTSEEEPELAVVFDREAVPSGYLSCYVETWDRTSLKILRPYKEASFPRNIAPPTFRWADQVNNLWLLEVQAPTWPVPLRVVTSRCEWRPDFATWEAVKQSGTGGWVSLQVRGCRVKGARRVSEEVHRDEIRFRVSPHKADPLIVYRLVSPLFHAAKTPHIYYRDISTYETRMFLPSKRSYCTNCHVFPSRPAPGTEDLTMAIAVRESTGGLRQLGLYDFGTREGKTLKIDSYFMCWDPEGTKVAVTGGLGVTIRLPITLETQEFYVNGADILIVDAKTLEAAPLPGASEPEYAEILPAWSRDGKYIVFARAAEVDQDRPKPCVQYDLYRVPYNGGAGGTAQPIPGASHNEASNFAPRFSPDGKWLVFNKANSGTLVEPTADLWIVSTEDGATPRNLECNNPYAMDSHHSWSSNSRWLMFATKRDDGVFARIYLAEIDEAGHASPPVELPTLKDEMMCYNVPEFLRYRPAVDPEDILVKVSRGGAALESRR